MTRSIDSRRASAAAALAMALALALPASSLAVSGKLRANPDYRKGKRTGTALTIKNDSRLKLKRLRLRNGPKLVVFLSKASARRVRGGSLGSGALRLGKLKRVNGTSTYRIPAGTDLGDFRTAVVWCQSAEVYFAVATLR